MELLKDQYAFRPTGSTCCAMVDFIHHFTIILENNSYIRCLFIDFSKAFDVVRHSILLSKISSLNKLDHRFSHRPQSGLQNF